MLELPMTALGTDEPPTVTFEQLYEFANLRSNNPKNLGCMDAKPRLTRIN
jgi:hypothetical protein